MMEETNNHIKYPQPPFVLEAKICCNIFCFLFSDDELLKQLEITTCDSLVYTNKLMYEAFTGLILIVVRGETKIPNNRFKSFRLAFREFLADYNVDGECTESSIYEKFHSGNQMTEWCNLKKWQKLLLRRLIVDELIRKNELFPISFKELSDVEAGTTLQHIVRKLSHTMAGKQADFVTGHEQILSSITEPEFNMLNNLKVCKQHVPYNHTNIADLLQLAIEITLPKIKFLLDECDSGDYQDAVPEIWSIIESDILLLKAKYDTMLNNNKLSSDSVEIFLKRKQQCDTVFDKVQLSLKDGGACSVKAHKNFLRKNFKSTFIGDTVKAVKGHGAEYHKYIFTQKLVAQLEDHFKSNVQKFRTFWQKLGVQYSVSAVQPHSSENEQQNEISDTDEKGVEVHSESRKRSNDKIDEEFDEEDGEDKEIRKKAIEPVADVENFDVEEHDEHKWFNLKNDNFNAYLSDDGEGNKHLIRLYCADPNSTFLSSTALYGKKMAVPWNVETVLKEMKDEGFSLNFDELNKISEDLQLFVKYLQIVKCNEIRLVDKDVETALLLKIGVHSSKNIKDFHRRYQSTVGCTRFFVVILRNITHPNSIKKYAVEKLLHAALLMNGVARGNKLAIDSENGGEFLQLSTILKDNSFQNNSIVAIKVLDKLQYLTDAGLKYACSLEGFKKSSVQTITPDCVPKPFLDTLIVNDNTKGVAISTEKLNFVLGYISEIQLKMHGRDAYIEKGCYSQDEASNDIEFSNLRQTSYPVQKSISSLVQIIVNHIFQISALQVSNSVNILVVGCEDPLLMVNLFLLLYESNIKDVYITVLEKNDDVISEWAKVKEKIDGDDLELERINFLHQDFLLFENEKMSRFDIAFTLITGAVSQLLSVKFVLLALQQNERPYYRCSKLFLAPKGFLDYACFDNGANFFAREWQHFMHYRGRRRESGKDIYRINLVTCDDQNVNLNYKFRYHSKTSEIQQHCQDYFVLVTCAKQAEKIIDDAIDQCFASFVSDRHNKLFADFYSEGYAYLVCNKDQSSKISLKIDNWFTVELSVGDIPNMQAIKTLPVELESFHSSVKTKFAMQDGGAVTISNEEGRQFAQEYLNTNVFNAYSVFLALNVAKYKVLKLILKSIGLVNLDQFHIKRENVKLKFVELYAPSHSKVELLKVSPTELSVFMDNTSDFVDENCWHIRSTGVTNQVVTDKRQTRSSALAKQQNKPFTHPRSETTTRHIINDSAKHLTIHNNPNEIVVFYKNGDEENEYDIGEFSESQLSLKC